MSASLQAGAGLTGEYYGWLRRHELRFQRCTGCGREVMLPRKKAEKALKKIISPADQAGEDRRNPYAL